MRFYMIVVWCIRKGLAFLPFPFLARLSGPARFSCPKVYLYLITLPNYTKKPFVGSSLLQKDLPSLFLIRLSFCLDVTWCPQAFYWSCDPFKMAAAMAELSGSLLTLGNDFIHSGSWFLGSSLCITLLLLLILIKAKGLVAFNSVSLLFVWAISLQTIKYPKGYLRTWGSCLWPCPLNKLC